ncbi:RNA 2'-phosphotransferase [Chryseolinea sp. T2]|uniref:RNA 2'-phosphotransferase n=1 Tax=Chryseolinea sp. T2 TaxID=3129255 RepID=UPI0030768B3E
MISEKETTRLSKLLSLVLRHQPEAIGISLDEHGWTDVKILIDKIQQSEKAFNFDTLKHIVDTNAKKRFAFNDSFESIRANQGHSVDVELGYAAASPPQFLYHGTALKNLDSIFATGLVKRERHHVHLSSEKDTAVKVGQRHGKPVVLEIDAARMVLDGFAFCRSDNGVWLTDSVPPDYIVTSSNP